jgi:hypothetical protein
MRKLGNDLKVGDIIKVWWKPSRDVITELKPYDGSLSYLWKDGAKLASFAINQTGMTIILGDYYEVVDRI